MFRAFVIAFSWCSTWASDSTAVAWDTSEIGDMASHIPCHGGACSTSKDPLANSLLQVDIRRGATILAREKAKLTKDTTVDVLVRVQTRSDEFAGTETGASISFQLGSQWTQMVELVKHVPNGGLVERAVRLSEWPSKLRIMATGPDAWCYDSIVLKSGEYNATVLDVGDGNVKYDADSKHWVDTDEEAPTINEYDVPPLPNEAHSQTLPHNCTTRFDSRVTAMGFSTAPEGTPCVFGVDARDEGAHCIYDDGLYGSLGWCYTNVDTETWGACGESCPLFGQQKILGKKIDQVLRKLNEHGDRDQSETAVTTTVISTTEHTATATTTTTRFQGTTLTIQEDPRTTLTSSTMAAPSTTLAPAHATIAASTTAQVPTEPPMSSTTALPTTIAGPQGAATETSPHEAHGEHDEQPPKLL